MHLISRTALKLGAKASSILHASGSAAASVLSAAALPFAAGQVQQAVQAAVNGSDASATKLVHDDDERLSQAVAGKCAEAGLQAHAPFTQAALALHTELQHAPAVVLAGPPASGKRTLVTTLAAAVSQLAERQGEPGVSLTVLRPAALSAAGVLACRDASALGGWRDGALAAALRPGASGDQGAQRRWVLLQGVAPSDLAPALAAVRSPVFIRHCSRGLATVSLVLTPVVQSSMSAVGAQLVPALHRDPMPDRFRYEYQSRAWLCRESLRASFRCHLAKRSPSRSALRSSLHQMCPQKAQQSCQRLWALCSAARLCCT